MNLPLIYTHVLYAWLFWLSFGVSSLSEILGPGGPLSKRHREARRDKDKRSLVVVNTSIFLGMMVYFLMPLLFPAATWGAPFQPVLFIIGEVMFLLGMILRRYAMSTLGRFFLGVVQIQADQHIVQDGPYKLIRHPAYSGMLIAALGTGMMMTNWASLLVLMLGHLVGLTYRIHVEEAALLQIQSYQEYIRRTKRLIPYIF